MEFRCALRLNGSCTNLKRHTCGGDIFNAEKVPRSLTKKKRSRVKAFRFGTRLARRRSRHTEHEYGFCEYAKSLTETGKSPKTRISEGLSSSPGRRFIVHNFLLFLVAKLQTNQTPYIFGINKEKVKKQVKRVSESVLRRAKGRHLPYLNYASKHAICTGENG